MRPIRLLEKGRWQDVDFVCNIYDVQSSKQEKLSAACGEWQLEERVSSLEVLKYPKRKVGCQEELMCQPEGLQFLQRLAFNVGLWLVFGNLNDTQFHALI